MKLKDYIWFWKTSWGYMKGSRYRFWKEIIPTTLRYRRVMIEEMKHQGLL